MKKAPKLKDEERSEIQILKDKGYKIRSIAIVLGRSPKDSHKVVIKVLAQPFLEIGMV